MLANPGLNWGWIDVDSVQNLNVQTVRLFLTLNPHGEWPPRAVPSAKHCRFPWNSTDPFCVWAKGGSGKAAVQNGPRYMDVYGISMYIMYIFSALAFPNHWQATQKHPDWCEMEMERDLGMRQEWSAPLRDSLPKSILLVSVPTLELNMFSVSGSWLNSRFQRLHIWVFLIWGYPQIIHKPSIMRYPHSRKPPYQYAYKFYVVLKVSRCLHPTIHQPG